MGTRLTTLKPYGSLYHPVYLLRNSLYIKSTRMEEPIYSPFFGVLGASSAMVFSAMGAAYGTAKSGTGIAAMSVMRPELIISPSFPLSWPVSLPSTVLSLQFSLPVNSNLLLSTLYTRASYILGWFGSRSQWFGGRLRYRH